MKDKEMINALRVVNGQLVAEIQELEQENIDKEDENARLLQQLLVAREDGMEIAERNAVLRKKLTEKHDDNARLQRQLAEEHNKLLDALEVNEDLSASTVSATVRMSNAEVANDDLHAQLERLTSMVATLWEERGIGVQPHMKMEMDDNPDYVFREVDDTGGTGLVYKIESDGEAVRFTATNGTYNDFIELPLDITYDLLIGLKVGSGGQYRF